MCQCGLCPFFWRLIYRKKPKIQEWEQEGQKIWFALASFCVAINPSSSCMNLVHYHLHYGQSSQSVSQSSIFAREPLANQGWWGGTATNMVFSTVFFDSRKYASRAFAKLIKSNIQWLIRASACHLKPPSRLVVCFSMWDVDSQKKGFREMVQNYVWYNSMGQHGQMQCHSMCLQIQELAFAFSLARFATGALL